MSLEYILRRFCQKTGLSRDNAEDKLVCLDYINEAAGEWYESNDYPGCLEEIVAAVNNKSTIALPPFVGIVRAIREVDTEIPWRLSSMRSRYQQSNWEDEAFMNWRDKGVFPVAVDIVNAAPPLVVVPKVDCDVITVTIVGSTSNASRVTESKQITELETQFETPFLTYESIKKDKVSSYDVIIKDAEGNEISIIYNNELEATFRIIDVSNYPFTSGAVMEDITMGMEILYKKKLARLINDTDELPVKGYDDVVINKAVQLYMEDKGNVDGATLFDGKAERTANRKAKDNMRGKDSRVETHPHGHDTVFRRMRKNVLRGWWN
jgi:hypothetical protein